MYSPRIPYRLCYRDGDVEGFSSMRRLFPWVHIHTYTHYTPTPHTNTHAQITKYIANKCVGIYERVWVGSTKGSRFRFFQLAATRHKLSTRNIVDLPYLSLKFINKCHFPSTNIIRRCLHSLANTSPHKSSPKHQMIIAKCT